MSIRTSAEHLRYQLSLPGLEPPPPPDPPQPRPQSPPRPCLAPVNPDAQTFIPIGQRESLRLPCPPPDYLEPGDWIYGCGWYPGKVRAFLDCPACAKLRASANTEKDDVLIRGQILHELISGQTPPGTVDESLLRQAQQGKSYLSGLSETVAPEPKLAYTLQFGTTIHCIAQPDAATPTGIVEFKSSFPQGQNLVHLAVQIGMASLGHLACQARQTGRYVIDPVLNVISLNDNRVHRFFNANYGYLAECLFLLNCLSRFPVNPDCPHPKVLRGRQSFSGLEVVTNSTEPDWVTWQMALTAAASFCRSGLWTNEPLPQYLESKKPLPKTAQTKPKPTVFIDDSDWEFAQLVGRH